jgi:uncharacterized protein (DUF362 family)/NAD-dependent dihydropyrimidine dehydrogenase PreA subunit
MSVKVAIERCADYDQERVNAAIRSAVDSLGGMDAFVKPGQRVLLKPNLLTGKPVEKAVCTHPAILRAVALLVMESGAEPFVGDSPSTGSARKAAEKCGLLEAALELGVELVNFSEAMEVENPHSKRYRTVSIARKVMEADAVISLSRVKTHAMMLMTMAVKNLFGCVVGTRKSQWHLRAAHDLEAFAEMLLSVYKLAGPVLNISDGIVAMEGNGPSAGDPRPLGIILASRDAVALDSVIGNIVGLRPDYNLTASLGGSMGLGESDLDKIEIIGPGLDEVKVSNFKLPRKGAPIENPGSRLARWIIGDAALTRPEINHELCTSCGTCIETCPAGAMSLRTKGRDRCVQIDRKRCIHCFCCQEVCPENAITPRTGRLARIFK